MAAQQKLKPSTKAAPDLIDNIIEYLVRLDKSLGKSRDEIEAALRAEFGGERWYVQTGANLARSAQAQAILRRFNGRNATEVARELGVSRATVYRVIKQPGREPDVLLSQPLPTAATSKRVG